MFSSTVYAHFSAGKNAQIHFFLIFTIEYAARSLKDEGLLNCCQFSPFDMFPGDNGVKKHAFHVFMTISDRGPGKSVPSGPIPCVFCKGDFYE